MNIIASSYVVIDTETSGLSPVRGDRVIEWAAIRIIDYVITEKASSLINVSCQIHAQAEMVHGISPEMLDGEPSPLTAWQRFHDFVGDATIIAHNAPFDARFIASEYSRLGWRFSNGVVCTLKMARRLYPHLGRHRLTDVARWVLGEVPQSQKLHRALYD
ncbi:MAG: 3'-5' exonuclease, partial [Candidatus Marinimicrobia bacterium]|nr:3'-5' exonuclease [Candidatus Neomarinimicrobiota bacterium]